MLLLSHYVFVRVAVEMSPYVYLRSTGQQISKSQMCEAAADDRDVFVSCTFVLQRKIVFFHPFPSCVTKKNEIIYQ